jgi:hypothetical protein
LFSQERHAGEAALRDGAHDFHDAPVSQVFVAPHEDPAILVVLRDRLEFRHQLGELQLLVLQENLSFCID